MTGSLFISDTNSRRIYRVRSLTGGRLLSDNAEVVAGTGEQCLPFDERCGDGGKATEATLMSPKGNEAQRSGLGGGGGGGGGGGRIRREKKGDEAMQK